MSERQVYHLRRIGPAATKQGVVDIMDFDRVTYMIGRSPNTVDYVIDSSNQMMSIFISRCHARVVRQSGNRHKLYDDSMNGIFVNNIKIAGSCVLQEGDRVTFGHPTGSKLPPGVRVRQPDSEYQFLFEECTCCKGPVINTAQTQPTRQPLRTRKQQREYIHQPENTCTAAKKQKLEVNESGDGNIFKVPKLQSSNSNRGDIVLTRPDETNNRGDIVLTRPDETNTQERNQAKNAKKSNAMAVTYESLCAVEEEDAGETVGNHAIDELKETTELEKWELEEMGETENATNLKTKSSLQETREDCFTGIKETVVKQKLVETAVNDTETKMECQISVELKECTEVKIDNSENVALSNEQENINAAGEDACRKPVLIEETDVIQSPILKEAQRLYDLVKDINKTFDQPEKKEWLEDNFQVEYEKKSDSTARTCKKELYSSDVEMEEKKTSHSIAVQTSPHQSLHIDSVEVDESVQSSQSSATESEISEGNCSQESSAMETDGSAVSEAQTVVLELYQTDNDNNDVTYDDLQCAIRSETLEKRIEIQCDETHDEIDLSNTVSETSAMTVEGDSTKMLNATITDSIVYSKPQLEEADGSKDTSDKKTEKLTRSETIRKDKSELEMLDDNAESLCSASTDIIAVSEESSITANENKEPDTSDKIILVASDSVEYDIESDEGSDLEDVSEIEEEIVDRADNSYLKEPGQKEEEFNKCVVEDNSKEGQEFATIKQAGHVEYQKSVQVPIDTSIPSACIILDSFENKETHLSVDVAAESISEESSNKSEKRVEMINHEGFVDELKEKRNQSEEHLSENGNQSDVMEDARTGMNLEIISVAKEVISVSEESSVTVSENKDQDNSDKIELIALDSVEYAVVSNVGIDLEDASEIEEEIVDGTDRLDNKDLKVPEQNEEELSEILTMQDDSKIGQEVITFEKTDCTVVSESNQESVNVPTDMSSQSPCISIDSFENEETPLSHAIAAESYSRESSYKSEKQVEMYIEGFVDELNEKQDQNEEQLSENGQTDLIEEDACSGMNLENISVAKEVISVSEESSITEIENKELVTSDKINPLASDSVEYNVESDVEINVEDVSEIGDETVDCIDRFDNGFFKYQKKKEDELSKMSRQSNSKEGREIFTYKKRDSGVKIYHTGVKYYQSGVKFYYAQIPIDRSSPSPSVSIDSLQNKDTSLSIEITDESSREEGNNKAEKEVEMINDDESVVIERSEKQAEDEIDNIHLSDNNDQSDLMEDACAAMTSENISVDSGDSDVASFENTSLMLSETVRYPVEQTDGEDNSDIAEVIEEMQEVKDDSINDTACKLNDEDFVHERDIRDSMKNMQPVVNCTETNEKKHLPYMEEEMVPDEENAYKWDSKQNQTECDLRMILSNKNDNDSRAKHDLSGKNITEENLLTVDKLDRLKLTQCENSMTSESAEADSVASNTSNQVDFIEPTTADDIPVKSGLEENVSDDNNKDQLLNKCIDDKHVAESENVESDSGKCSATVDLCDSVNLLKKEDNVFLESLKYNIESKGQCGIEQRTEMLEEMPRSEIHAKDSESAFYLINATFESNGEMISSCEREMSPHDFENNEKVKINSRIENFVDTVEVSMNRNTDVGMSVRSDDDCMDHEDDNHTDQNCEIQMAAEIIERTAILKEENIEANSDIKLIENSNCLELHMSEGKSNENEADGALRQGLSVVEKCSELTPVNDRSAQVSVAILEDQHAVDKMDQVSLVSLEDAKQTDSSIDHNEDPEVAYETTVHSKNLDSDMNNVETDKNVDQMEHLSDKDQSIKQVENIEVNEKDELIGNKKASEKEVFTKEASENSDATGHPPDIIGEPKTDEQNIVKTQDKATNHADFGPVQNEEDTNDVRRDGKAEIEPGFKNYPLTFKTIVPSPGTLEMTMCTESNFLGKVDQLAQNIDKAVDNDSNKPDIEMENQNFVAEQNGVTATVLSVMQPSYHCQYQPKEPESETCEKIYDKLLVFGPGRGYDYKLTCTHEEENFEFNSPVRGTEFIEHIPISTDEGRSKLNGEDSFEVSYSENCMPVETGLEVIAFSQCVTDFNKTPNELKNIAAESTEDENLSDMCKESVAFESVSDKKVSESCRIPNDEDIVGLVHETTEEIVDKCEGHGLDYKSSDVQPNVPVMEFNGSGINHSLWSNGSKMDVSEDDIRRGTKNRKRKLSNSDELSELPVKRICNNEGDGNNGLSTGNVERRKKIKNERAAELKKHVMMFLKFRKKYEKSKSSKSFDKRDAELKTNMRTFFKFREKFEKLKSKASQMIRQDTIERQVKRFFKRWSLKKKYCEIHTQSTNTESSQSDTDIDMASTEKSDQVSVPMEFKDCEVPEKTEAKLAQFVESENSIVEETVKVNEIIRENDRVVFAKENGIEIMLSDTGCTIQNTSSETMYVETLPHNDNESLPNVCERTSDMNNMILEQKDYHEERQVKTEVVENVIIEKSGIGKSDLGMLFDAESAVSDGTSADKNEKTQDSQMSDAAEKSKYTQADTRLSSDISMNLVACSPDNDIDAGCGFMPNHMKGNELNKVNSEFDTSKTDVNCIAQATDEIETIRVSEHEHEKENGSLDSSCTHTNENISESTTDRTIKHNEDMKSVNSIEEHALNANISDNTLSNMKASDSTGELVNVENECQKDNDDAKSDVEKSETITPDEDSEEEDMEDLKDDGDDVDDNDDDNNDGCGGNNAGSENEEGQENERSSYGENDSNGNDDSNQGNETEINMDDEVDADEQVHEDEKRTYDDNDGNDENELPFENKTEKGGEADSEVKALDNVLETGGQNKESDDYPIVSEYKAIDSTNIENNQTQNSPSNTPEPEKNVNMSFQKNLPKQIEPLSCQFSDSDDDNEDFVSPIIQMPCLDDDSNSEDDIQCGQREVQISIANEKTDSESHAGVSSDGDIQCGQRQAYISIADEKIDSDPQAGVRSDWDIQCGQRKAQYIIADDLIDSDSQAGVSSDEKENTLNCIDKQEVMIYTDSDSDVEDSENESTEDLKHDDDDDNDDDDDDDNDDDDDEMSQIIQNPAGDDDTEFSPDLDLQFQDNGNDNDEDSNGSQNIESNERDDAESDNEWLPFPEDNNSLTAASDHDDRDDWDSVSLDKGDSRDYEKEDVQNVEDEMESSDTDLDTDVDGKEENYRHITYDRVRTPSKRKRDFEDEELMSPKIARCDSKRMSSARSIGMSEEAKNTFKSPNIPAPSRRKHNSHTADSEMECHSPHAFSSTQMLSSSQQPDLDDLSLSQMTTVAKQLEVKAQDKSQSTTTNRRARELLAMLKAKKEVIETTGLDNEDNVDVLPLSQEGPSTIQSGRSEAEIALMKDEEHIKSAEKVIKDLHTAFKTSSLRNNTRIQAWSQELATIEQKLTMPKTVIAVVGGTGEGKSSLMNALLDHQSVLPTSGIRACTAVVVEVVQNTNKDVYEADIEFLQRKEWFDELHILIRDLSGPNGDVRKHVPDPTTDTYASFCKVKAVYGGIDKFEVLSRMNAITRCLGRVKTVRSYDPEEFRKKVEKFIETKDHNATMQYWPIVKHVRLRMPNCDVLGSGAVLVDLPGVRDSNAARDRIAKEYLKNCTAVWVVSRIHRAIDDKTAKTLLGESFRRQLLMDGQYGSIAFICSHTDALTPSEIINNLKLETQTEEIVNRIKAMELEKRSLGREMSECKKENRKLNKKLKPVKKECEMIQSMIAEVSSLDVIDVDNEQSEDNSVMEELQAELKGKETQITEIKDQIREKDSRIDFCHTQINEIDSKVIVERKEIAAICARARNEYARVEIKKDFKAGLREMKRQAGAAGNEELDDYNDDEDNDNNGSSADNLQVFCCSATEYQKMKNLIANDGPSQIFNSIEDTEVPRLRNYVHEMTRVRKRQCVERLIRSLGRFVFDLQHYTGDNMTVCKSARHDARSAIDIFVEKCRASLGPVTEALSEDIEDAFDHSIRKKLETGSNNAVQTADKTCALWGGPKNNDRATDSPSGRKSVGICYPTYKATVSREGEYKSKTFGQINFNEDLVDPIYKCLTIVWNKVFSGLLWTALENVKDSILQKLRDFSKEICLELQELGVPDGARVCPQMLGSADHKLGEMITELKEVVTNKQREISRVITPHVQEKLTPTYNHCGMESGPGTFQRTKDILSSTIDKKKYTMFHSASQQLMTGLLELKEEIVQTVKQVVNTLLDDLKRVFQPLWEAPSSHRTLQTRLKDPLVNACSAVREIYRQAGLTNTEEQPDPPAQTSTSTSTMSQTITLPSGAVMSLVNKATEVDCFGSSTSQHGTVVTTVKSMASQSSCMAASSASGTSVNPSTVSQLTGQRHEAAGVQAGIVGPGTSAGVKEEPRVLYSRRPEEQGRNVRVVQVKQESVEYNCAELGANVPLSQFGQDTLERLSKGNLELLPMSSSENQPKQPIPNQPRQPIPNQPRQQIPSHPRQPILNQPRQPVFNQQRQPISNQPRQPIPIISKVIPVAPCHLESGNLKANQSNKISRNQSVSVADSQKLKVASSKNVTATSSQQLKETGSQKVMETGILNRLKEKIVQTQTGSIFAGGNGQKENLTSVATMAEKRRILCAKRSRFEDRLERLSQNFNSPPESESSAALKSATTSAINVKNRKETESPEKTFLKNATKFGAKLSSLIESRNSSPGGRGGCDEVSGSDTDMESESQSRHNKAKRVRASLSLSRKGTPQKSSPMKRPSEIKSEPEEDGYPGRRKKSKLCEYVDLTQDDSD